VSAQAYVPESIVVFPLGDHRFALPTAEVVELFREGKTQTFPHTTPAVEGVLVRRGQILPVWDIAAQLRTKNDARKFWLVTTRNFAGEEPTAIPVSGQCQMLRAEIQPPADRSAEYVRGVLVLDGETVEVLDLRRLSTPCFRGSAREPSEDLKEE
jgi:purine-binding chemotaxis protein CheW